MWCSGGFQLHVEAPGNIHSQTGCRQLSERDPTFAAEVEAKEATRAEAARVMTERMNANAKAHRTNRELSRIQQEAMTPQELTPEEVAARGELGDNPSVNGCFPVLRHAVESHLSTTFT